MGGIIRCNFLKTRRWFNLLRSLDMRVIRVVVATISLAPICAFAAGPVDGSWQVSIKHMKLSAKPYVYLFANGQFTCASCVPEYTIKADGTDQKVSGHADYDSEAVTIIDSRSAQFTDKLHGKIVETENVTVSADGLTRIREDTDFTGKEPSVIRESYTRVADAPSGAHVLSGSWRAKKIESISGGSFTSTYEMTDTELKMSSNGQSYDAKFDGNFYPIVGDPANPTIAVKKIDASSFETTVKQLGKVVSTTRRTVSADGKTMHVVGKNVQSGRTVQYTLDKLP
jgi:hypothetical protein